LPLEALAPYLLQATDPPSPFHWTTVFGDDRPVEIEVGCGKGLFLITAAQSNPATNFVGIEIERKYHLFTANRVAKRKLTNVRMLCGDARRLLHDCVPAASIQGLHVYFPDPWWKQRHRKRRVFNVEFVEQCERVLRPDGWLRVASDVQEYFTIISALFRERSGMREEPWPERETLTADLAYFTNFERKARLEGKPIHRAVYARCSAGRAPAAPRGPAPESFK
jgi:tRNA (guanine-N7-)-methyltransferase